MSAKPIAWTIAGTDPSSGAGIQADLKTMTALGVYGCSVITAVIAQTASGVAMVEYPSDEIIKAQLTALGNEMPPDAIKIGMLGRASTVRQVTTTLRDLEVFVVCDPVLASTSGASLLEDEGIDVLIDTMFPCVSLLTPNIPEAERLTGLSIESAKGMEKAADILLAKGLESVLVKGGHSKDSSCRDYWTNGSERAWLTSPRHENTGTHGSGCTLSSAIAAHVSRGQDVLAAIAQAKAFVNYGIRVGSGYGSLAHDTEPDLSADMPVIENGIR